MHSGTSFPVGKVDFLDLFPLNFFEFLNALGEEELVKLIKSNDFELIKVFSGKFIDYLKQYLYIGGMPEVVNAFIQNKDYNEVREIQNKLLIDYEQDFSKHAPNNIVPRIRALWNNIPTQLSKENKKFIYGLVKEGARAREYETALAWLIDCGLIYQINRVNDCKIPLAAYHDVPIFYWSSDKGIAELDYIIQLGKNNIPIEVKSSENLQAKSLKTFVEKYNTKINIRTSLSDYREEEWLTNIPLYIIGNIENIIK